MNEGAPSLVVVIIEDDAPLMRAMEWALNEEGWDVRVVSKVRTLELRDAALPDVAIFNLKANAPEKTIYNRLLRVLNPDCIIIDVDEFTVDAGSIRDSGADSYTERPMNLDAVSRIIREFTAISANQREARRNARESELHADDDESNR
jgi:ActR/RegA family two-component response regulator